MKREWLISKRMKCSKTQEQIAEEIGIKRTTYASYEQGERTPSVSSAKKIGDFLNFSWTIFFE